MNYLGERLLALLERVATYKRPCRRCGVPLYIVTLPTGAQAAFTAEGEEHAHPTQAEQQRMFAGAADVSALDPER